jgi:hypothetical protein
MKPRVSILNLLFVTTIVAMVIVVYRLRSELAHERQLRTELLQKGGILQVSDPNRVHVVQVSTAGEPDTHRWRVYVPPKRTVTLDTRLDEVPADKPPAPRLPPNAIVVGDRSPVNPQALGPGEHVITLRYVHGQRPLFNISVVSASNTYTNEMNLKCPSGDLAWSHIIYGQDLTPLEHTAATMGALWGGHTVALDDAKTFVLRRYRAEAFRPSNEVAAKTIPEILMWLHADE